MILWISANFLQIYKLSSLIPGLLQEAYSRTLTCLLIYFFPDQSFSKVLSQDCWHNISPCASVIPPLSTSPARQATSHHTSTSSLSLDRSCLFVTRPTLTIPWLHLQQPTIKYPATFINIASTLILTNNCINVTSTGYFLFNCSINNFRYVVEFKSPCLKFSLLCISPTFLVTGEETHYVEHMDVQFRWQKKSPAELRVEWAFAAALRPQQICQASALSSVQVMTTMRAEFDWMAEI